MSPSKNKNWSLLPKKMLVAGAALAMLTVAGQASADCTVRKVAELSVDQSVGLPLVDGSINGRMVKMVAATSANSTLYRSAMSPLQLHEYVRRNGEIYSTGGLQTVGYTWIDSFRLTDMPKRDLDRYIVDRDFRVLVMGEKTQAPQRYAGALGAGFWSQADDDFDLGDNTIRLVRPKGCKGDQIIDWPGTHSNTPLLVPRTSQIEYLVTVMVNGVPLRALLDSGAGASVLTGAGARKLGMARPLDGGERGRDLVGTGKAKIQSRLYRFKTFTIGGETIQNPRILYADIYDAHGFAPDGMAWRGEREMIYDDNTPEMLLGTDFFRSHRVMISNSQRQVYFAYNGAPVFN